MSCCGERIDLDALARRASELEARVRAEKDQARKAVLVDALARLDAAGARISAEMQRGRAALAEAATLLETAGEPKLAEGVDEVVEDEPEKKEAEPVQAGMEIEAKVLVAKYDLAVVDWKGKKVLLNCKAARGKERLPGSVGKSLYFTLAGNVHDATGYNAAIDHMAKALGVSPNAIEGHGIVTDIRTSPAFKGEAPTAAPMQADPKADLKRAAEDYARAMKAWSDAGYPGSGPVYDRLKAADKRYHQLAQAVYGA